MDELSASPVTYDVFISHATEDKEEVVIPLYHLLTAFGLKVWVDKFELRLGDSLNRTINEGLKKSRFGVVILSKSFFKKEWTQKELDGLVAKEDGKDKVILPVWHGVQRKDVAEFSLILADKMAVLTEHGIPYVAGQIFQAINWRAKEKPEYIFEKESPKKEEKTNGLPSASTKSDSDERAGMRAYLQRSEVRLSTMHRIAGVFLNGAGLLVLFPIFFSQTIQQVVNFFSNTIFPQATQTDGGSLLTNTLLGLLLLAPFLASLYIPLYALVLLLKDIVHFYFTGHNPGYSDRLFNPRFALSGLALSSDEAPTYKKEVLAHEYSPDLIHFILPFDEEEASYFDDVKDHAQTLIIPESRTMEHLDSQGVFQYPNIKPYMKDFDRFNTALGLAGVVDRTLSGEVAKMEASLVRHSLSLRRLVLRYLKALLMFIWTVLVSFLLVSVLGKYPYAIIMGATYFFWSLFTPVIVKLPIKWILELSNHNAIKSVNRDKQLMMFERKVSLICNVSAGISLTAVILLIVL